MPYVTQNRPLPPPNAGRRKRLGTLTRTPIYGSGPDQVLEIWSRPQDDFAGLQTTYSWRTGRSAERAGVVKRALTGPELRKLIYSGQDFDADNATTLGVRDRGLSQWDNGHEFWTRKSLWHRSFHTPVPPFTASRVTSSFRETLVLQDYTWHMSRSGSPWVAPEKALTKSQRVSRGSSLLKQAMPFQSQASLSQLVAEFTLDGPLSLLQSALLTRKGKAGSAIGSDYLNYQFGWVPTLNDLRKVLRSLTSMTELILQFERDMNKVVRRTREVPVENTNVIQWEGNTPSSQNDVFVKTSRGTFTQYSMSPWVSTSNSSTVVIDEITTRSWFSGAFSYGHPLGGNWAEDNVAKANYLLGMELSVSTLWELAPWSWLLDWFSNIGDCISVIDAQSSGTVIRYGYVMNSYESERTAMVSGLRIGDHTVPAFLSWKATHKAAYRDRCTPFGFGIDLGALSGYQWSILAALGMTRGPRKLRGAEPS